MKTSQYKKEAILKPRLSTKNGTKDITQSDGRKPDRKGMKKVKYIVSYELRRERGLIGNEYFDCQNEMVKWLIKVVRDVDVLEISKV
jgi:hypothetical protein